MNSYWVYVMSNKSRSSLYIGVTSDLKKRIWEHRHHIHEDSFTAKYNICELLYFEESSEIEDSIAREKQLKGWTRKKKLDLIRKKNPALEDLAADWL